MTRTFARRFNRMYNQEFFPEPTAFNFGAELIKIPGLDGSGKMGKSEGEGNAIFLADDPKVIRKKVMRAVTDTGPTIPNQPMTEGVANLFSLMRVMSKPEAVDHFLTEYNACTIRYGDLKKQLAEDIIIVTTPIRERIEELAADEKYLSKVVKMGAEKAHESAGKTIGEVREIIGFRKF
jgi:tryptophanyl-tRNA synthetase